MSLQPQPLPPVPEQTQRIAKAAFKKNNLYLKMRDAFDTFLQDEQFTDLFPVRGKPAESPWRLMLVTLFQFVENLSDRQAADAVRARIDWKYALSLELDDEGFDASLLCEFRTRLIEQQAENRLFEAMLARFSQQGLLKTRGRQRTDSTHVLTSVRVLCRIEIVGETLRHALNVLAEYGSAWLTQQIESDWFDRYSLRVEIARLSKEKKERDVYLLQVGQDGSKLLSALWRPGTPAEFRTLPAVETLRRVWLQQFRREGENLLVREEADSPSCEALIRSPYDPDARLCAKREMVWTGYKVHLTETCDEETPHLITQVETTASTMPDVGATPMIQARLDEAGRMPSEHLVDEGYTQAGHLVNSQVKYGVTLLGPVARDGSRQAVAAEGFGVTAFTVDWERECAIYPAGKSSVAFRRVKNARGAWYYRAEFALLDCRSCEHHSRCTRSKSIGRSLYLHPQGEHEALHARRVYQKTGEFSSRYSARAGIEGTLSEAIRGWGCVVVGTLVR